MKFFCFPVFACRGKVDSLDYSCQKLETVPDAVLKCGKHLEELDISMNSLCDLPPAFFKLVKMQRLILSFNRFEAIPVQFGDLKNLVELDFSNNGIVDIAPEIELSPHLVIIDLSSNVLSAGTLPKSIVNLANLTHLNISNNPIAELPEDIDKLQNLRSLDARQCDLRQLPASIVKLRHLHRLDVGENNLAELPAGFEGLENLREFDAEENDLIVLSNSILGCTKLESLVISENRLREIPSDIGELTNLIELNAHSNEIERIPSSIRLLTSLKILRLNNNMIEMVPQAIGSLSSLHELYLNENRLQSIPSSIGNLKKLNFLDVSSNNIIQLPPTIGSLENLGSLLVRSNKLGEIPSEIGKLSKLRILDVVDNSLEDLPYTLLVIKESLRALYLTADRPLKIGVLKESRDKNNILVLTHYMLPQKNYTIPNGDNKSAVGGARVCFAGDVPLASEEEINDSQEDKALTGNFDREKLHTPHPKQFGQKYQKALQAKRNSQDMTGMFENQNGHGAASGVDEIVQMRPLRSVLKTRPQSTISASMETGETKTVIVRRINNAIGWNIYGGIDCRIPFKDDDHGFFVSKLESGGAAEQSGIVIGDKLLAVNGRPLKGLTHDQCVNIIQDAGDLIEFRIESVAEKISEAQSKTSLVSEGPPTSFAPSLPKHVEPEVSTDVISVPIKCELDGSPGFTICGGTASMPISIKDIIPHGPADSTGLLRPGDRILSVNGTNVKMARPEQVHALIKAVNADLELYLVVERVHFKSTQNLVQSLLAPSRSMPSLFLPHFSLDETQSSTFTPYHVKQKSQGHARKPSGDFPTNYFVDLTTEPRSAFGPNRSKSIDHLVLAVENSEQQTPKANQSYDCTATISSKPEKSQSPKPSQLRQPSVFVPKKVVSPPTSPISTPEPLSASSPAPPAQTASTSRIPQPSKIPPPVAPKPKTNITTKSQTPETLAFNSKIKRFEELQQTPAASTSASPNKNTPPPKKPLLSSTDLQKLKESEQLRMNNNTPKLEENDEENGDATPSEEYEQRLNHAVSMPAVVRTKNAEMRKKAAEAAANSGIPSPSPAPSSSSSSELQRSDSAASTSSLRKLDPQEIEKQKRWREARMKSVEIASKQAEGFLNELRQISRLSNISEDRSSIPQLNNPSPIPTT